MQMLLHDNATALRLYGSLQKTVSVLFFAVLLISEWRFIGLPINGRPFKISLNDYLSVSVFDFVLFALFIILIPNQYKAVMHALKKPTKIINWIFCLMLFFCLFYILRPKLPYLTPNGQNVINLRSLFLCMLTAYVTYVVVQQYRLITILKFQKWFYLGVSIIFLILSCLALNEVSYFRLNYPFNVPSVVSFPFPSQNIAAFFLLIAFIGVCKISLIYEDRILPLIGIPSLMLAISVTGSRSCFLVAFALCMMILLYAVIKRKIFKLGYLLAGLLVAAVFIGYNYNWQPITRSTSVFFYLAKKPSQIIKIINESNRWKMWNSVMSGSGSDDKGQGAGDDKAEQASALKHSVNLAQISNGDMKILGSIDNLKINHTYHVTFNVSGSMNEEKHVVVKVESEEGIEKESGTIVAEAQLVNMPHFYRFISDSDHNFIDRAGQIKFIDENTIQSEKPEYKIERYESPYNGSDTHLIVAKGNQIRFNADEKKLVGYVNEKNGGYEIGQNSWKEYTFRIERINYSMPLEAPTIFLAGFHDTDDLSRNRWKSIRNGLLLIHSREVQDWEVEQQKNILKEKMYLNLVQKAGYGWTDEDKKWIWRMTVCDNRLQARKITYIWDMPDEFENNSFEHGLKMFNGRIDPKEIGDIEGFSKRISTQSGKHWDYQKYLAKKSSTHNSYLDMYHYTGIMPLFFFVLFILSSILIGFHTLVQAWFTRGRMILMMLLFQLIAVALLISVHPYIWLRFIWVLFGYATALFIRDRKEYDLLVPDYYLNFAHEHE